MSSTIKPQSACTDLETVAYSNVVAAVDKRSSLGYGAVAKGAWYDEQSFVSPLDSDCEDRFSFNTAGQVRAADQGDAAAAKTIDVLKLDHDELVELRREAIGVILFDENDEQSLASRLEQLERASAGTESLAEFEFAARSAAEQLLAVDSWSARGFG